MRKHLQIKREASKSNSDCDHLLLPEVMDELQSASDSVQCTKKVRLNDDDHPESDSSLSLVESATADQQIISNDIINKKNPVQAIHDDRTRWLKPPTNTSRKPRLGTEFQAVIDDI
jgi:hypothetical protein